MAAWPSLELITAQNLQILKKGRCDLIGFCNGSD